MSGEKFENRLCSSDDMMPNVILNRSQLQLSILLRRIDGIFH